MPDYRLYLLDPHSGHINGVDPFHSADDVEAICLITQRAYNVPTELWSYGRKVARFDAKSEMAAGDPTLLSRDCSTESPLYA